MSTRGPQAGAPGSQADAAGSQANARDQEAAAHAPEAHAHNSVPAPWAKFWLGVLFGGCVGVALLDLLRDRAHADHPWEHGLFFYALYGFLGISLLIVLSKGLRRLVMRREDYYDDA